MFSGGDQSSPHYTSLQECAWMSFVIPTLFQNGTYEVSSTLRQSGSDLVVFLHGLGCSSRSFDKSFQYPGLTNYSLFTPDFVGFGGSIKPQSFSYSLEDHASILCDVISTLSFERLHIVGHSFGAAIALLFKEELISKTQTFINCEGNLISQKNGLVARRAISGTFEEFQSDVLPDFRSRLPSGPGFFEFDRMLPEAFYHSAESLIHWSDSGALLDRFLSLPCKKAFLFGDKNSELPILQRIPLEIQFKIVNSGHFLFAENPSETYNSIVRVIEDV
jgi:pimeloyl-ACP methyl ester carboxylesterase